jgi:hypothetical protein
MDTNNVQLSEQAAKDLHVIASPFHAVGEAIKVILFILILPVFFLVRFVNYLLTGEPVLDPWDCYLAQAVLIFLNPLFVFLMFSIYRQYREKTEPDWKLPLGTWSAFFIDIVLVVAFVKYNSLFLSFEFFHSQSTMVSLSPLWIPILGLFLALWLTNMSRENEAEEKAAARTPEGLNRMEKIAAEQAILIAATIPLIRPDPAIDLQASNKWTRAYMDACNHMEVIAQNNNFDLDTMREMTHAKVDTIKKAEALAAESVTVN